MSSTTESWIADLGQTDSGNGPKDANFLIRFALSCKLFLDDQFFEHKSYIDVRPAIQKPHLAHDGGELVTHHKKDLFELVIALSHLLGMTGL